VNDLSLLTVRTDLEKIIRGVLAGLYSKILIQSDVGVGKTACLKQIHKFTPENPLICFPSHDLKNEFVEDCSFPLIKTPDPPKEFQELHKKIKKEDCSKEEGFKALRQTFPSFYQEFYHTINQPGIVVTTHDAFLISPEKFIQPLIIFDEVPNSLFGNVETTSLLGIYECEHLIHSFLDKKHAPLKKELSPFIQQLKDELSQHRPQTEDSLIFRTLKNPIPRGLRKTLFTALTQNVFHREYPTITKILQHDELIINDLALTVSAKKQKNLPSDKKYVCFSATPDVELFSHFGFRHLKTEHPELRSTIIHVNINTSRQSLRKPETYKKINTFIREHQIDEVITFKGLDTIINRNAFCYFGNTEGTNKLKGIKKLGIVGTPMNNIQYFYDLALVCNKNLTYQDFQMETRSILFKNQEIEIYTFRNDWLTVKLIEQIGFELMQALGRIRPFEEECLVYLFSKIPFFSEKTIDI